MDSNELANLAAANARRQAARLAADAAGLTNPSDAAKYSDLERRLKECSRLLAEIESRLVQKRSKETPP